MDHKKFNVESRRLRGYVDRLRKSLKDLGLTEEELAAFDKITGNRMALILKSMIDGELPEFLKRRDKKGASEPGEDIATGHNDDVVQFVEDKDDQSPFIEDDDQINGTERVHVEMPKK